MLAKEAVSARLNSDAGISFTEFSYQILQGMDFLELYRRHGCTLQTGGSDQWGNLTAGTDLIHRVEGVDVHVLATPLVTKADGTKFGKTEGGTVWLDAEHDSPYAFYQFWLNAEDAEVVEYLRFFTFRTREEIDGAGAGDAGAPAGAGGAARAGGGRDDLVHGAEARRRWRRRAGRCSAGATSRRWTSAALADALAELPLVRVPRRDQPVADLFAATGLVPSKSAARRAVAEGGAYVNNRRIDDEDAVVGPADLLHGRWLLLRRGRRSLAAVELSDPVVPVTTAAVRHATTVHRRSVAVASI